MQLCLFLQTQLLSILSEVYWWAELVRIQNPRWTPTSTLWFALNVLFSKMTDRLRLSVWDKTVLLDTRSDEWRVFQFNELFLLRYLTAWESFRQNCLGPLYNLLATRFGSQVSCLVPRRSYVEMLNKRLICHSFSRWSDWRRLQLHLFPSVPLAQIRLWQIIFVLQFLATFSLNPRFKWVWNLV